MSLTDADLAQILANNPDLRLVSQNRRLGKGSHQSRQGAETTVQRQIRASGPIRGLNRGNKYRAQKTQVDGITFDSKREARRWQELKLLERAKEIWKLERQVTFELRVKSILICKYRADFVYHDKTGQIVEDVKGVRTDAYRIKRNLMSAIYGIKILET